jgi:hypothetical protein
MSDSMTAAAAAVKSNFTKKREKNFLNCCLLPFGHVFMDAFSWNGAVKAKSRSVTACKFTAH